MAITTARPAYDDVIVEGDWAVVGTTYFYQAFSDDLDTTYGTTANTKISVATYLDPDGQMSPDRIKRVRLRLRAGRYDRLASDPNEYNRGICWLVVYRGSSQEQFVEWAYFTITSYEVDETIDMGWRTPDKELSASSFQDTYNTGYNDLEVYHHSRDSVAVAYLRVKELWLDIEHFPAPTHTVDEPTGFPTTSSPTVRWTYSHADFAQLQYEVKVFTQAQYQASGFDPNSSTPEWTSGVVVSSSEFVKIGTDLVDGTTYRAYVRVAADWKAPYEPLWSSWQYSEFTIDVTPAALPDIRAERIGHKTLISLEDNSTDPAAEEFRVEKKAETEDTWYTVRDADAIQAGSALQALDVELRPNETTEYRARSVRYNAAGDPIVSEPTASVSVYNEQHKWLLKDLLASLPVFPTQPTFSRASTAYLEGIEHASGAARFPNGNSILIEEGTTNLLTANQSSIETDVTEWGVSDAGTAISRITTDSWHGSACMRVVADGSITNQWARTIHTTSTQATYIGSAYVKWVSGAQPFVQIEIEYTDGTFAWRGSPVVGTDGTWQRLVTEPFTTDSAKTVANVKVYVQENTAAAAFEVRVDGIQLEQKPYAGSWHIGGSTRAAEALNVPASAIDPAYGTFEADVFVTDRILNTTGNHHIADYRDSTYSDALVLYFTGTSLRALSRVGSTSATASYAKSNLTVGWHRIAMTWESEGNLNLVVDGVIVATVGAPSASPNDFVNGDLGSYRTGQSAHLNSSIDTFRLSNRARTSEELADYTAPLATDEDTTYLMNFEGSVQARAYTERGEQIELDVEQDTLDQESTEAISRFQPLGAPDQQVTYPIVVKDAVHSEQFGVTLGFVGRLDYEKFKAIRKGRRIVVLTAPMRDGFWYAVFDSPMRDRLINMSEPIYRQVTVGIIEVDRP